MRYIFLLILLGVFTINVNAQELERYKKINDTTLFSEFLKYDKPISIYVPVEWQKNIDKTYPLTIIFDRQNKRTEQYIVRNIDFLTATDQMPSTVIISVDSQINKRFLETSSVINNPNGLLEKNKDFVFNELIPFAENTLKVNSFRLFIGHSRYGYFTADLFANHIDKVSAVISIEPFFTNDEIDLLKDFRLLSSKTIKEHKYFRYTIGRDSYKQFKPAQEVLDKFKNSKIDIKGTLFSDLNHFAIPSLTVSHSLYEIFQFWSKQQNTLLYTDSGFEKIEELQDNIKKHYADDLSFSLSALYGMGFTFYNKKEYHKAIEIWNTFLKSYPNFSEAYLNIIKAEKKLGIDTEETILNFKKSIKASDFYNNEQKNEMLNSIG